MLKYNLSPIFKARGITNPYHFLVQAGFSPYTTRAILDNSTRSMNLNHIEFLCKLLVCEPYDFIVWTPDANERLPKDHPLQKLAPKPQPVNILETLRNTPYEKLTEITRQLYEEGQEGNADLT